MMMTHIKSEHHLDGHHIFQLLLADSIAERTNLISLFPVLVVMEMEMIMMTHIKYKHHPDGHHIFQLLLADSIAERTNLISLHTHVLDQVVMIMMIYVL